MELEAILRDKVKPELNHLFTERPALRNRGMDFGWFCREHAYIGYFVCRLLGAEPAIHCGDISLTRANGVIVLTTVDDEYDHAWLSLGDTIPVDMSVVLRHFEDAGPGLDIVYGTGVRNDYWVSCGTDGEGLAKMPEQAAFHLHFSERETVSFPATDLLGDPFLFLHKPPGRGLTDALGKDIFEKIIYHVYRVAKGEIGSCLTYGSDQMTSLKRINKRGSEAPKAVRAMLRQGD